MKELRHDFRMNQTEFAAFLGINLQQYNRYEKGTRQPTLEVALRISEKVNRTVNELFYVRP
ncbi:helix-turn-helix transcriptional regulator [Bacillus sp. JJ722]